MAATADMHAEPPPAWHQRAFVAAQYLIPQRLASRIVQRLAATRWRPAKRLFISAFLRRYAVDMRDAELPNPHAYPSFNAFFTRALRPEARPLGPPDTLLCPADGHLSQCGTIDRGRIFQAKGQAFDLTELLGGEQTWADPLAGGAFATIYLSPRDYHRVHMPISGTLRAMSHVPGRRFSVNPITTRLVPRLFARNERVICLFDTAVGPLAMVLVGALFVGSIATVWAGTINPRPGIGIRRWEYGTAQGAPQLERGAEMGRFNMGSTVILVLPRDAFSWHSGLRSGDLLRMGQPLGEPVGIPANARRQPVATGASGALDREGHDRVDVADVESPHQKPIDAERDTGAIRQAGLKGG